VINANQRNQPPSSRHGAPGAALTKR